MLRCPTSAETLTSITANLQLRERLGPFIRGKIRRVLNKTRTVPFIRACLI